MFYNRNGRTLPSSRRYKKPAQISLYCNTEQSRPVLYVPTALVRAKHYIYWLGRGKDENWIGFEWTDQVTRDGGTFTIGKTGSRTTLLPHKRVRDVVHVDLEYKITPAILYVKLPLRQGLNETKGWWRNLPDVRSHPFDGWDEVREVHHLWGHNGDSDEEGTDDDSNEQ